MLIGVIGKPSVGKSTFFKAATLAEVEIASYPFTTIKPNRAIGFVRVSCVDKEFNKQCNPRMGFCLDHNRFIPVELIDVAGLVEGAHEGKGLGSQFLNDLNEADALIHIIDISGSTNEKGEIVKALSYDPLKDIKFIEDELNMWYYQIMKKGWEKFVRTIKQENQNIKMALEKQLSGLRVTEEMIEKSVKKLHLLHHPAEWSQEDLKNLAKELRTLSKPMIIAANKIDIEGAELNFHRLKEKYKDYVVIQCSADAELALKEAAKFNLIKYIPGNNNFEITGKLNQKQKAALEFIQKNVLEKFGNTGVQNVLNNVVFDFLKYIAVYPGGVNKLTDSEGRVLPDCFLMKQGSTALDFAYKLHTDFGKNFIKAIDVKKKLPVGRDYILKNRDVIEIVANR